MAMFDINQPPEADKIEPKPIGNKEPFFESQGVLHHPKPVTRQIPVNTPNAPIGFQRPITSLQEPGQTYLCTVVENAR